MQKWLFLILSVAYALLYANVGFAQAKPVLVVFPIETDQADAHYSADLGIALQQGLAERYEVYYGPDVEKELQKEYEKLDCTAEQCRQNVAIAFNGELVANASAKRAANGYLLKLTIRNVFTGKMLESDAVPCRACDVFAVVEAFKAIGSGETPAAISQSQAVLEKQAMPNAAPAQPAAKADKLPRIPAFLPLYTELPATAALPIDGDWLINKIDKRIRIESGRAYALDSWRHLLMLKIKPKMVVLKDIHQTEVGHYQGYDLPLAGPFEATLQPNGRLKVTVQGALGTATYDLVPLAQ